jgi:ribosomal protein S18 acetylase RimI-like enzyme
MNFIIETYQEKRDANHVYDIWNQNLKELWPIKERIFKRKLLEGKHFVVRKSEKVIGFIATQQNLIDKTLRGGIMLILVDRKHQRQGIGKTVLNYAIESLSKDGICDIQLGAGGGSYFWPGVPKNIPTAIKFFKACGWKFTENSFDLVGDMKSYKTPPWIYERIKGSNIQIKIAEISESKNILEFEKKYFPKWYDFFKITVSNEGINDVLIALDSFENVVGSVLLFTPQSRFYNEKFDWELILGKNTGGFGALGVTESQREKGIGMALSARASEILGVRKVKNSWLGWTWLSDWYGKIGYKVWREYAMSWKKL